MKILICMSNVPDTTTKVRFVENNTQFDKTGVQWVINPWDELAITRALELKEDASTGVSAVSVISVGGKEIEPTLRKAMAIGADDAIRVEGEAKDPYSVACMLGEVIKSLDYDLILCGIESSDYNGSAVGGMLAEVLDYDSVSAVSGLSIEGGKVKLTRDIDGGKESIAMGTPLVAIVQKGIAKEPRIPAMRGIMMAKKKPLQVQTPATVEPIVDYQSFELPQPKAACKMVDPEDMDQLVELLKDEAKVI